MAGELVLDLGAGADINGAGVFRSTDPVVTIPTGGWTPGDFTAQYPVPLDTTEIVAMCEEVTALMWLQQTEEVQGLKSITWRELNELAFWSGSPSISFADGDCPEEYRHDGDNSSYDLKNIGIKKGLSLSDILHSAASRAAGYGIANLGGVNPMGEGMPGAFQQPTLPVQAVADLKAKELALGTTLLLNGHDNLLINGSSSVNSLQFNGIAKQLDDIAVHTNDNSVSGTFGADAFNRFLSESCAKPQTLLVHPTVAQEILSAYFQLGFQGAQVINLNNGPTGDVQGIIPGFNFAAFVNTSIGRLGMVSDTNVPRTNIAGGKFQSKIYALRMTHQGAKLVYMITQIPISYQDLLPGCTTISFEVWGKTGVVVKHKCAHGVYTSQFTGRIITTCPVIL